METLLAWRPMISPNPSATSAAADPTDAQRPSTKSKSGQNTDDSLDDVLKYRYTVDRNEAEPMFHEFDSPYYSFVLEASNSRPFFLQLNALLMSFNCSNIKGNRFILFSYNYQFLICYNQT